eukprot:COSAG04_NODE_559_length_12608_cov_12.306499_2_plen_251_part_00
MVSPTVLGRLRRGGEVKEAAAELIVKYNCIAPGSSTLKAVLPFANPDEGEQDKIPVSFMWLINCLSLARPGFTVRQVPMSLPASRWDSGGQAVVTDGDTKRNNEDTKWSVNSGLQGEYLPAKEPADLFTAPAAENATRFVVGMVAPPAQPQQGSKKRPLQVIPTPSHLLDHISPIFSPFFPVFCAFSPSRRGGSNKPQAGTQGQETVARAPKHRFSGLANSGGSERMAAAGLPAAAGLRHARGGRLPHHR